MKSVRAHVQNGQIVFDEPVELQEGADVKVVMADPDELTADEHAELERALDESTAQFERGEFEDARTFALGLLARS